MGEVKNEVDSGLGRVSAAVRGVCPRCRRGAIFSTLMGMRSECDECGLIFEREQGYFAGAMYISYAIAIPLTTGMAAILGWIFRQWTLERVVVVAFIFLIPFAPLIFRYSRIFWIHFDRSIDP